MAISFSCPNCGKKLKAPDSAVGKSSKCPGCNTPVTCPEPVYEAELIEPPLAGPNPYDDIDDGLPYGVAGPAAGQEADTGPEPRKPCPMCGEMIVATAAKCRFCGEVFDAKLKKAKKKKKKGSYSYEEENLSGGDIAVAILCSGIGCIAGLVWMIQGKPKGGKMLGLSILMNLIWGVVRIAITAAVQNAQP